METKERIADKALRMIEEEMTIGLGGGSTVACLVQKIAESNFQKISVFTLSDETRSVCQKFGLSIMSADSVDQIDISFDGCDLVDHNLQALKTLGGIQTQEKITAALSKRYILLTTSDKFKEKLVIDLPICCEVLPAAMPVVRRFMLSHNLTGNLRLINHELQVTKYGNYLLDLHWPSNETPIVISEILNRQIGIVSHSVFIDMVTDVLVGEKETVIHYTCE